MSETPVTSEPGPPTDHGRWVMLVIGVAIGLLAGLAIVSIGDGGGEEPAAAPATEPSGQGSTTTVLLRSTGKIGVPAGGETVRVEQIVSGNVADVPAGHKVWVLVQIGAFYPSQEGPLNVLPDGRWTTIVVIGSPEDTNKTFLLHLVETSPQGTAQFTEYLRKGQREGGFPGITRESLPPDVRFLDSLSVVRS